MSQSYVWLKVLCISHICVCVRVCVCVCVFVCVCHWPPVRAVCPNHEVAVFQHRTVTAPDLGSITNAYTYSIPPAPPVPNVFWIFVYSSPWTYLILPPHL